MTYLIAYDLHNPRVRGELTEGGKAGVFEFPVDVTLFSNPLGVGNGLRHVRDMLCEHGFRHEPLRGERTVIGLEP